MKFRGSGRVGSEAEEEEEGEMGAGVYDDYHDDYEKEYEEDIAG